jgi:transposase
MELVNARCAGLAGPKQVVVACALTPDARRADGPPRPVLQRFGTMTDDLVALAGWLAERGVVQVALERTGVSWRPVYNLLAEVGGVVRRRVNAHHRKAVPGRKTLESANLKLAAVASDVTGGSARAMRAGLVAAQADPAARAELAVGRRRDKRPALERALVGRFGDHHRSLVPRLLAALDARIAERERPFAEAVDRLDGIPGVGRRVAEAVIAEVGATVARCPSAQHLAAWAGLRPGPHESAGKRRSGTTRKGNPPLRRALVQAAHAAGRARQT